MAIEAPSSDAAVPLANPAHRGDDRAFVHRALEASVRIGVVALLAAWCFEILRPFLIPVIWGIILAVAVSPGYRALKTSLGERRGLAAAILTVVGLLILCVPAVLLGETLVGGAQNLAAQLTQGGPLVPPPPENVQGWPVIGPSVYRFWALASTNLEGAIRQVGPQIREAGSWVISTAANAGFGILQFVFAIIIAGVLLAYSGTGYRVSHAIATRLAGEQGPEYADLAEATVRGVARGILGVALIQSLLAGIGFLVVGLPAAGLLALLCLVLAVVQIGVGPVMIPAVIYVFATADTVTAVLFMIWGLFVIVIDNVLKPILLGQGARVPMIILFLGAIGGFLAHGIVGLFVGAVVLSLGYELFVAWIKDTPPAAAIMERDDDTDPAAVATDRPSASPRT